MDKLRQHKHALTQTHMHNFHTHTNVNPQSIETQTDEMNGLGLANGSAVGVSSSHLLGGGGVSNSYGVDSSHFSSMTHHHPAHSSQLTVIVPGENVKQVVKRDPSSFREFSFIFPLLSFASIFTSIFLSLSNLKVDINFRN